MRTLLLAVLLPVSTAAQGYQLVPDLVYDQQLGLRLDIYLPLSATPPYPTVVWVHGGGWQSGSRSSAAGQASQLCPRGYAVVGIDYRLTGVAVWPAQIHDCKGAVRWLRANAAQYGLDPDRFGAWGSSAGGHLVACLGTMHGAGTARIGNAVIDLEGTTGGNLGVSSRVQAACDWFGPTEFVRMREFPTFDHDAASSPESRLVGGPIQANPDRCATANSITFLTPDDAPLLIMHGTDDTTVPFQQSELLHRAALLGTGLDVAFVPVPNTGHGGAGFQQLIGRVFDFFDSRLRDLSGVKVSVVASDTLASEPGDPGEFKLQRTGSTALPLLVATWTADTALPAADYGALPQLVLIPAGSAVATVAVTPRQDALVEGSEDVTLRVCASLAYRIDSARDEATVTISDDEVSAGLSVVTIAASDASAAEPGTDGGALMVSRTGSTAAALSIEYRVSGSAINGIDVAAFSGALTIPALAASATMPVTALDDGLVESGEYVTVALVAGTGYVVGTASSAGVVIADDDRVATLPVVSVSLVDITASEDGSETGIFAVTRTGATASPLTVPFALGGRAVLGADYTLSLASPVTIPAGAQWVRIAAAGRQDSAIEGDEPITLSAASGGGWQLASQPSSELRLVDDDAPAPVPAFALAIAPLARGGRLSTTLAAGRSADPFALLLAGGPGYVALGGGVLLLDPATVLPLANGALDAAGAALVQAPVPDAPALLGAIVHWQAVSLQSSPPALAFTAAVARRIE
jgi:acetyl esterase/lipase